MKVNIVHVDQKAQFTTVSDHPGLPGSFINYFYLNLELKLGEGFHSPPVIGEKVTFTGD